MVLGLAVEVHKAVLISLAFSQRLVEAAGCGANALSGVPVYLSAFTIGSYL